MYLGRMQDFPLQCINGTLKSTFGISAKFSSGGVVDEYRMLIVGDLLSITFS